MKERKAQDLDFKKNSPYDGKMGIVKILSPSIIKWKQKTKRTPMTICFQPSLPLSLYLLNGINFLNCKCHSSNNFVGNRYTIFSSWSNKPHNKYGVFAVWCVFQVKSLKRVKRHSEFTSTLVKMASKGSYVSPLSNPKGVKHACELCGKPATIRCQKCKVTYYW